MNPLLQTPFTWRESGPQTEKNTKPSVTQPDMTMSLQELLERHVRGLEVPQFPGNYEEEGEFVPNPKSLDLSDIARMKEENLQKIEELKKRPKSKVDEGQPDQSGKQKSEAPKSGEADKPKESDGQKSPKE